MRTRSTRLQQRRLLAFALSFVLVSQWLAVVHLVVHPSGAPKATLAGRIDAHGTTLGRKVYELAAGHEAGSSACQLLDQLSHAMAGVDPPALLTQQAVEQRVTPLPLSCDERPVWGRYLARAPPVLA